MDCELSSHIRTVDERLFSVARHLNLSLLTPTNLEEEQKQFFKSEDYNPVFTYAPLPFDVAECYETLNSLKWEDGMLDGLYRRKANETLAFLRLLENRGTPKFTRYSIQLFGQPSAMLLNAANAYAYRDQHKIASPPAASSELDTKRAVAKFESVLRKLQFKWEVSVEDIVANALVVPAQKKLIIKKGIKITNRQLTRLMAHEVFTHVLRAECGMLQPYQMFHTGLEGYEPTEEGLALYKEQLAGVLDSQSLKGYAGRVLAIQVGLHHGFRKTFDCLSTFYSKEQAWNLTVRVKRGLEETAQPGALTKDLIYLKGYLQVKRFAEHYNSFRLLHHGKVGIHHTALMPNIEGLKNPDEFLRNKFKKSKTLFPQLLWW